MRPGITAMLLILSGCVSTHVDIVGKVRAPTSPDSVQVYLEPPRSKYDSIANLSASSAGSFALASSRKIDVVIERLKRAAAKVGANGILLHGVGSRSAGSVGAGISTESESGHSPYNLGFGTSALLFQKSGEGEAIFVHPELPL